MTPKNLAKVLADTGYASMEAIALLVLLLEQRGVLEEGIYRETILDHLNNPDAEHGRVDRSALKALATLLEKEG